MDHDPEVRAFLRRWTSPPPSAGLDARMQSRYAARRQPLWRRRVELRLSIPVPLLAMLIVLAVSAGLWVDQRARAAATLRERLGGFDPVAAPVLVVTHAEVRQ